LFNIPVTTNPCVCIYVFANTTTLSNRLVNQHVVVYSHCIYF